MVLEKNSNNLSTICADLTYRLGIAEVVGNIYDWEMEITQEPKSP